MRRFIVRCLIASLILIAIALSVEFALEVRDVNRYMPGQTFAAVGDARIRYKLAGADRSGAPVVFLSGIIGSLEQVDQLQSTVSRQVPSLSYDRAGYGFSRGSTSHSAWDQAGELAGLLDALNIKQPVVLVPFSFSADLARVFAGRYPERTAGLFMIAPSMPNLHELVPKWRSPQRRYARFIVTNSLTSPLGYNRLMVRLKDGQEPKSPVEQRADAVLARRPHYWALAQEWYALGASTQQALEAPVPPELPIEIVFPQTVGEEETVAALTKLYGELVARTSHGKLVKLADVDHSALLKFGPEFDHIVTDIVQLSQGHTPE